MSEKELQKKRTRERKWHTKIHDLWQSLWAKIDILNLHQLDKMPSMVDLSLSVNLYSKWCVCGGGEINCSSNPRGSHSAWWASVGLWDEQFEMAVVSFLLVLLWSYYNKYSFFCSWSLLTLLACGIHKTHFELVASIFLIISNLACTIKVMLDFYTWHSNINSEITDLEVGGMRRAGVHSSNVLCEGPVV